MVTDTRAMERTILENGYQKLNKTRHGLMLFNKHDCYIGRSLDTYGEWCWPELEATRKFAVGLVVDIGANIGTHTLVYSQTASQVIAVEPQYTVFQTLLGNLALNCIENVLPHFGAFGDENGKTKIMRPDYSYEGNFGCVSVGKGEDTISLTKMDTFQWKPDLIKIDAEGSECNILIGARETIKRSKPVMYIEADKNNFKGIMDILRSYEYEYHWHKPLLYQGNNFYQNTQNIFGMTCSENLLCFPRRRTYAVKEKQLQEMKS